MSGVEQKKWRGKPRSRTHQCGKCYKTWNICACPDDERTESISSILSTCKGMEEVHRRHLCVFLYIPYRRWASALTETLFSAACIPCYEGWSGAWIRPSGACAQKVSGVEDPVLECHVCFHDEASQIGYITRDGSLVLVNPAVNPRHGVFLDPMIARVQMDVIPVSQMFTLDEIESGNRGTVHGTVAGQNNKRRVTHIVSTEQDGTFRMQKFPQSDPSKIEFVSVDRQKVLKFLPSMREEYLWRNKKRFSKYVANSMQPYLESFCAKARADMMAEREAANLGISETLGSPPNYMKDVVDCLLKLNLAIGDPPEEEECPNNTADAAS